jgi:hypothetical protein
MCNMRENWAFWACNDRYQPKRLYRMYWIVVMWLTVMNKQAHDRQALVPVPAILI